MDARLSGEHFPTAEDDILLCDYPRHPPGSRERSPSTARGVDFPGAGPSRIGLLQRESHLHTSTEECDTNRASGESFRDELTASNGTSSPSMTWTPRTLRPGFLYLLSGSASLLSTVVTLLCWVSETKHGLGTDYRSSILLLGWKFSPSLITVLYVQLTAMLLDDVKRAEPFAGLARAGGSTALWTVLKVLGAWWNALYDGLSKNSTGRRNWLLISSAILNVVGFLAISPYHLPLLTPKKRPSKGRSISGEQLQRGTLHSRFEQTEVYLRTIARVLQNTAQECDSYVGVWSRELEDAQR